MSIELWIPVVILLCVIVVIEGIIILRRNKSYEKFSEKYNEMKISAYLQKDDSPIEYISSEKIRKLKENEEQIKKKRAEATKEMKEKDKGKVEKQKITSVIFQDGIRAGEVQRGEREQFNLRKDEESMIKPEENGKWWI